MGAMLWCFYFYSNSQHCDVRLEIMKSRAAKVDSAVTDFAGLKLL
jgi:hypothetical protein